MPVNHFGKPPVAAATSATSATAAAAAAAAEQKALERKEAYAKLSELVGAACTNLEAAVAHADKHGLTFSFHPSYGMGGTYYGEGFAEHEGAGWAPSEAGWLSSSQAC